MSSSNHCFSTYTQVSQEACKVYANKMDNPEEIDKFLETYSLPKLNQEETDNLNRSIIRTGTESVIKRNSLQTEVQDRITSEGRTYKHKKNLYLSFLNSPQNLKRTEHPQIHSMRSQSPDTKTRQKHYSKRKLHANSSDEYRCKNPQQNTSKQNLTTHKKDHAPQSSFIHCRVTMVIPFTHIDQSDTAHQENKRQKQCDHINRCSTSIW